MSDNPEKTVITGLRVQRVLSKIAASHPGEDFEAVFEEMIQISLMVSESLGGYGPERLVHLGDAIKMHKKVSGYFPETDPDRFAKLHDSLEMYGSARQAALLGSNLAILGPVYMVEGEEVSDIVEEFMPDTLVELRNQVNSVPLAVPVAEAAKPTAANTSFRPSLVPLVPEPS